LPSGCSPPLLFASTLVIVSSWLGLGVEDAADRLRALAVGEAATDDEGPNPTG